MVRQAVRDRIPLVTTNLIVAEVHRFVLFHVGIRAATLLLDRIDASARLSIEFVTPAHHTAARHWLTTLSDQVTTYTDAVSFAVMDAAHCTAVMSFDHDLVWEHYADPNVAGVEKTGYGRCRVGRRTSLRRPTAAIPMAGA